MKTTIGIIVMGLVFSGIGMSGGWYAARQTSVAGPAHEEHEGKDAHAGHDHEGADHLDISAEALKNLGVTFEAAAPRPFSRSLAVPAVVASVPAAEIPLTAPVPGRILEVRATAGSVLEAGSVVVTILRDAIPPPELVVTADVFQPAGEQLHQAIGELRKAKRNLDILREERARVEKFAASGTEGGVPILPKKSLIDLQYEVSRAEKELANAQCELERHGLSAEQCADVEKGSPTPFLGLRMWKKALEQNGMWPAEAEAILLALPESSRNLPRVVASIGELAATGLASPDLAGFLKEKPGAGGHFLHIASLLQKGTSLREIQFLHDAGALEAVVEVRVPKSDAPDLDVREIVVKPGECVEAGARIAVLEDSRALLLRAETAGGDAAKLLAALGEGLKLEALPLVEGTGPALKDLPILYVRNDEADSGTVGVLKITNEVLVSREAGGARFRTWKLRPGLRYMLHVPIQQWKGVYVVPSDAVVEDGLERVVFLRDGDGVKPVKVVVVWQDHEVAVLDGKASQVFPDDEIAQHGAFALRLALRAGAAGAEGGHHHHH